MMRLPDVPEIRSLSSLTQDGRLLFRTRILRLFAYGLISVILVLYLAQVGFDEGQIGLLLSLTLMGDTAISLWLTTHADRVGRRRTLLIGAGLMILAGGIFGFVENYFVLVLAAVIGTISPSGNEVGPFLAVEQSGLAQTIPDSHRTQIFAWYNLAGSMATACGALCAGGLTWLLQQLGTLPLMSYRVILILYALLGCFLLLTFRQLSPAMEPITLPHTQIFGLSRSRKIIFRLSTLFALDAFGGGLVVQSFVAYWFFIRFGADAAVIGAIFFAANLFSGLSALAAARIATRIGLVNTMVFTHLPSNILLILIPLMPSLPLAVLALLARFSISQMDVPTRQSYVMAVVDPNERSAAAGVTGIVRTMGAACSPVLSGSMLGAGWLSLPFFAAGSFKIVYDLILYRSFRALKPHESQ